VDAVYVAGQNLLTSVTELLPGLIAAILVFLLGWVIAILVSRIFRRILKTIKLEEALKEHKVEDALGTVKISDVLTKIVKYYILLIFLQAAASLVWLGTISSFLMMVLLFVPVLIAGILVVLVSVILGEYLKEMIIELSKSPMVKLSGRVVKLLVIYVGVTMGLATIGFNTTLITGIFLTILQGIVYGLALAIGIAFGLGGQDDAKDMIKSSRKHFKL
jgi:MFS family permease